MVSSIDITARAPQIRTDVTVNGETNFAEALARLLEDPTINDPSTVPGTPLGRRLQNILDHSGDTFSDGISHFSGIFRGWTDHRGWGDTGFRECFQDHTIWPGSSMQVGHFMTAVDMGYRPIKLYLFVNHTLDSVHDALQDPQERRWAFLNPPPPRPDPELPLRPGWWTPDERQCVELIIAHEQTADSGVYGEAPSFWNQFKTMITHVTEQECDIFRHAFDGLGSGPVFDIGKAQGQLSSITIGTGSGDSRQDLLLSLFGFKFGTMIRKSELTSLVEGGNWVRGNLKDPRSNL